MPNCVVGSDQRCHRLHEKKRQQESKLPARQAPLGVLPVHGPLTLDSRQTDKSALARGGLAGWQRKRVVDFIEQHLSETITLSTLAAMVQLSPFHFARAFKQTLGLPPHRYHMSRRIERAKALLADRSVTEVAVAVGYAETSSFSSRFRRATGISPSNFAATRRGSLAAGSNAKGQNTREAAPVPHRTTAD
jgi:AraC family transcriptional regulator